MDSIIENNITSLNIIDYEYFKAEKDRIRAEKLKIEIEKARIRAEKIAERDRAKTQRIAESNSDKLNIGINANAGGLIPLGNDFKSSGPSANIEFIKNNFYSIINLNIPIENDDVGFGFSGIFNYLWKSKIGDFYLGGGLGYTYHTDHFFTIGVNAGYRFVTSFGMYFCVGGYLGGKINDDNTMLDIRPVLGVGYMF
jgi:hypothetical protein